MRARQRSLVSTLKLVVLFCSQGCLEGLAHYIFEGSATSRVEFRMGQLLSITAAVTDTETAVAPDFPLVTESEWGLNIGTEARGADWPDAWHFLEALDLGKFFTSLKHQGARLLAQL